MKTQGFALISAAAMLAGGIAVASAQTGTSGGAGGDTMQGQCWDEATKQVKSKAGSEPPKSTTGAASGATSSTAPKGGTAGTGTAGTRPAGIQNC